MRSFMYGLGVGVASILTSFLIGRFYLHKNYTTMKDRPYEDEYEWFVFDTASTTLN